MPKEGGRLSCLNNIVQDLLILVGYCNQTLIGTAAPHLRLFVFYQIAICIYKLFK